MFVIVADLLGDNGFVWQCLLGQFFCFLTQKKKKGQLNTQKYFYIYAMLQPKNKKHAPKSFSK
jgi:hypothetical protein